VISTHWIERRTPYWRKLDALITRVHAHGLAGLARDELQDLWRLYRQVASDLATVREDPASIRYAAYLNQLLTRAHHIIYAADRVSSAGVWTFFRETFPRTVRSNLPACALAVALFAMGAAVGAALTLRDPDFITKVLGASMVDTIAHHQMWTESIVSVKPAASSAIMTNNMSVTFMTFASGITAGLGTIYMLVFNGLLIGVVATACALAGMSVPLWSFIAPHGVLELPAIFIAGGAGLRLAHGMLFPGVLPRGLSITRAGHDAVRMVLGCVPMLFVAGIIEAFVSPTNLAAPLKFTMGAALLTLLARYLFGGRAGGSFHSFESTVH
jgi:uncharacterized membrane protein SpoIIM required for sporulation